MHSLHCPASTIVVIGDRYLTDVAFGNVNGALTIHISPVSTKGENFAVSLVCEFSVDSLYFRPYLGETNGEPISWSSVEKRCPGSSACSVPNECK